MAATKGMPGQRERIVRAARHVIARDGLSALRVRSIAADVGLSHASLLHYFGSKDVLIAAVVDSVIRDDIARPLVEDAPAVDPVMQLRRLLVGMTEPAAEAGDDHHAVMLELLRHGNDDGVVRPLLAYTTIWRDYLVDLIRGGQASGHLRTGLDPVATAGLIIEVSLGLQTRTPLPGDLERRAVAQLLGLLTSCPTDVTVSPERPT